MHYKTRRCGFMKKTLLVLLFAGFAVASGIWFYNHSEQQLSFCISRIIAEHQIPQIKVITKDRGSKPILQGELSPSMKKIFIDSVSKNCAVSEIQDFIREKNPEVEFEADLNIQVDTFNKVVTVRGDVHDEEERDEIIKNLSTAAAGYSIAHLITIDDRVQNSDFPVNVSLLFSAIGEIKYADITLARDKIVVKGLIRDEIRENEAIEKLNELFADELQIVDQLELGIENNIEVNNLKFEKSEIPKLETPKLETPELK